MFHFIRTNHDDQSQRKLESDPRVICELLGEITNASGNLLRKTRLLKKKENYSYCKIPSECIEELLNLFQQLEELE